MILRQKEILGIVFITVLSGCGRDHKTNHRTDPNQLIEKKTEVTEEKKEEAKPTAMVEAPHTTPVTLVSPTTKLFAIVRLNLLNLFKSTVNSIGSFTTAESKSGAFLFIFNYLKEIL